MSIHRPTQEQRIITPTQRAPATRTRSGFVLALACTSMAIVGIDTAIVNVALASIQHDLGIEHGTLQWVVVAYGLLLGGFLLLGGRLADQLGRRRVFVTGSDLDSFHTAFTVIGVLAVLGVVVAATGFARSAVREGEMA